MSNFKEIYPQINFREDLYRMDSLGEDDYEVWAYNGDPDFAPLSADYSYELVKNVKTTSGKNIIITDGINMPLESFKLYGESSQIQTTGNQLVDFNNWPSGTSVDYIFENDTIDVVGKTSEKYPSSSIAITTLYKANPGKVLCFDFEELTVTNRSGTIVQLNIGHSGGNTTYHSLVSGYRAKTPWTIPNNVSDVTSVRLCIYPNNSTTASQGSVHIVKPTLQFGTDKRPYEPYTGGKPSPAIDNPMNFTSVGTWNPSTNYYEVKCKIDKNINLITNSSTIKLISNGPVADTKSVMLNLDSSFNIENYAGKQMTMSFDCSAKGVEPNTASNTHRYGMEYSFSRPSGNVYIGKWFWLPADTQKHVRAAFTLTVPADWNGNIGEKHFYVQRISAGEIEMSHPKLEPGNRVTPYIPHVSESSYGEEIETIYSPQPLSSLQNGIKDYYDNGWLYLSTVYEYFRAIDNWEIERALTNNNVLIVSLFKPNAIKSSTDIWCTHFKANEDLSEPNRIKIDNQRIYVSLDKTTYPDLDTWLQWLQDNIVTICYQRKNTIKIASEPAVLLHTYDEVTNIINDQDAEMEVEYRVAPNARIWERQEDGTFRELTS